MKLTVTKSGETVKAIIMEFTPEEALIVNHAMRRYTEDEGVNERNREEMDKMLFVEPRFTELEPSKDGVEYELKTLIGLRDEIMKNPDEWFNRGITLCGDLAQIVFDAIDKYIKMERSQNGGRK